MNVNEDIVKQTIDELDRNPEWEKIYSHYAKEISDNHEQYEKAGKYFRVPYPFVAYSTIGDVKDPKTTKRFDLRFCGQSVGTLKVNKKDSEVSVLLCVSEKQSNYARDYFGYSDSDSKQLKKGVDWHKHELAKSFRKFYKNYANSKVIAVKSNEHRIESFLLKEFSKKKAIDKILCNIQPVKLGNRFFQLTTPLKGSKHQPIIALRKDKKGATGGGIDILARIKHKNGDTRLAIIELKDENKESESQLLALEQAMIYATFITKLLRSGSGSKWWNIFHFTTDITSKHLDLDVVTIMPEGISTQGSLEAIQLKGLNITLHPYTLYYKEDSRKYPCEFSGTLTEDILRNKN